MELFEDSVGERRRPINLDVRFWYACADFACWIVHMLIMPHDPMPSLLFTGRQLNELDDGRVRVALFRESNETLGTTDHTKFFQSNYEFFRAGRSPVPYYFTGFL